MSEKKTDVTIVSDPSVMAYICTAKRGDVVGKSVMGIEHAQDHERFGIDWRGKLKEDAQEDLRKQEQERKTD